MARIRIFIVLALAVVAGGTFAFGTYRYLQNAPVAAASTVEMKSVVVAAGDLSLGTALRPEDLRTIQWPASNVPAGVFASPDEIVGRGLIQPVTQNEIILPAKLASKEAGSGLPPVIPEGFRAMSVRVNDVIGVAGYVLPGTRVDVVAVVNPTQNGPDVTSKVILTNVQVLAAGTKIEQDGDGNKPMQVTVVTLLVGPEEAERLTLASTEGKIQLALRNPLDKSAPATAGIKPASLMASGLVARPFIRRPGMTVSLAPKPVVVAEPLPTVEIIRGDKRAREAVVGQ